MLLAMGFLDMAKFTTPTPLSLLFSYTFSLPVVGLNMSSLSTSALKSPNNILMRYLWDLSNIRSSSS
jgi:hypothetical protein